VYRILWAEIGTRILSSELQSIWRLCRSHFFYR